MDKPTPRMTGSLEKAAREMHELWGENAERVAFQRMAWADQLGLSQSAETWRAVAAALQKYTAQRTQDS